MSSFLASTIVDPVFAAPGNHSSLEILFAIYAYAFQIYADFTGYTDIAIGIALLLGIRFPQNFDSPYIALEPAGLLAALAHDAVALAARLPLHPARRQPRRPVEDLPQPDAHDAARRPVARRGVDVRGVGRHPRRRPRRRAAAGATAAPRSVCPSPPTPRAPVRAVGRHVQHRVPGVGVLPVAHVRRAPSTCSAGCSPAGASRRRW